jgi:acylglycerol lipase
MLTTVLSLTLRASAEMRFEPLAKPAEFVVGAHGHRLAIRRWRPESSAPTALLLVHHGGGWHSGYYDAMGRGLAAAGYEVLAFDAAGHGHSEGPGALTFIRKISDLVDDLRKIVAEEKATRPGVPIALYGESQGAIMVTALAAENDPNLSALVVSAGLFRLAPKTSPPAPVVWLIKHLGALFPQKRVVLKELDATFDEAFGDPRWAAAARKDPLIVVNEFFLGSSSQTLKALPRLMSMAPKISQIPVLVQHPEFDTRTDPAAAKEWFESVGSADKTLKMYPDASHQMFQDSEENVRIVTEDLVSWLDARFKPEVATATPDPLEQEAEKAPAADSQNTSPEL